MLTIKELIKQLAGTGGQKSTSQGYIKICFVISVDGLSCDCRPVNGDADIDDVRLVANEKEEFFVLIPKAGSIVIVESTTQGVSYVSMVSEISEVKYKIGDSFYSVTQAGHLVQKGDDTLKQVLTMIVEAVQQIVVMYGNNPDYVKLTEAMTKINNLLR